jgi:predicted DNA-binding transcriptional regulator
MNNIDISKPIGLQLNSEQSKLLLKGLESLSLSDKKVVIYDTLVRELKTIIVIWERRIKNEQILKEVKLASKRATK